MGHEPDCAGHSPVQALLTEPSMAISTGSCPQVEDLVPLLDAR